MHVCVAGVSSICIGMCSVVYMWLVVWLVLGFVGYSCCSWCLCLNDVFACTGY